MKELPLHPLSALVALRFDPPRPQEELQALVAELFDALAGAVAQGGGCVIGHIKGLARAGQAGWLRVSIISAERPAQVEASLPEPVSSLELAVNFMVYGREPEELFQAAKGVVGQTDRAWSGLAELRPSAKPAGLHLHSHPHHHP